MQNEDMKRLLAKDNNEYKIVGYERKILKTFQQPTFHSTGYTPSPISIMVNEYSYSINNIKGWTTKIIKHNAFEQGIKVGDDWLFEGDRFVSYDSDFNRYILVWRSAIPEFQENGNDSMIALPQRIANMEHVGNIHERNDNG